MSVYPGTSGSSQNQPGSSPHKWLFSKKEMQQTKSIQDGFTAEKELKYRQLATRFIQETVDELNIPYKEKGGKISQLCMCAASIHMHRFFYFHSFKIFNYMDIAAACLFLAGKSEESPRKLAHICEVWWAKKFPKHPRFPSEKHKADAMALIVQLENVVLQTIAFDLKIDLPHPVVLNLMHSSIGHAANDHGNKKLTEIAYFFATDVLCVTSWGIRFSAADIAVCCVHIMCTWSSHEIPVPADGLPWYHKFDPTMTDELLQEMTDEFLQIYTSCKDKIALSLTKYTARGLVNLPQQQSAHVAKVEQLPPPPPPPTLAKKVDYAQYKERVRSTPSGGDSSSATRKSFIPDTSQVAVTELPTITLPGMEPLPSAHVKREHPPTAGRRDDRKDDERRKEKERRREEKAERRRDERPEDREKRKEEERRKREHDRMTGHNRESNAGHPSSKKPRPEVPSQSFVSASSNGANGFAKSRSSSSTVPVPMRRPGPVLSPPKTSSLYNPPTALSPPPPPPPMKLSPPPPPPPSNELEEGEVE